MNIHPFLVHFPIALLSIYALMEIIRIKHFRTPHAIFTKGLLVVVGSVSAFLASIAGEMIEGEFRNVHNLVEVHSAFASLSQVVFGVLAVYYLLLGLHQYPQYEEKLKKLLGSLWKIIDWYKKNLSKGWLQVLLAISGIIAICFTGALGAAIVHGPEVDSFVQFAYNLFF